MSKETKFELAKLEVGKLKELDGFRESQEKLVKENPFIAITDNETYIEAKKRRTALVSGRTYLTNQDKLIASELKKIRTNAGQLIADLVKISLQHEEKQQAEVKRYEGIKEAEKARKAEGERQRIQAIKNKIEEFENKAAEIESKMTFGIIDEALGGLHNTLLLYEDYDFGEFEMLFEQAMERATRSLNEKVRVLQKEEAQRLENERLAKEAEEANRKAELQSKRIGELLPYSSYFDVSIAPTLGEMPEEEYLKLWNSVVNKKAEQDRIDNEAKAEKEKKDAEEAERQAEIEVDKEKIAEQQEEIRKNKEYDDKISARIKRLTQEIGLKWDFDTSFVGEDGMNVSMVEVKTLDDDEYSALVQKLLDFKNRTQKEAKSAEQVHGEKMEEAAIDAFQEYTPPSTFHDNEIDKIEEVDFEVGHLQKPIQVTGMDIDLSDLRRDCQSYIDFVDDDEKYHEDNDFKYYIFETAVQTVFGKDVFDYINNRRP